MAERTDWFPGTRVGQLAMARNWLEILALRATAWGVPATEISGITGLSNLTNEAGAILAVSQTTERTVVITAQCVTAFTALEEKMRYIKRNYFNMPPRILEEIVSLGLRPHDSTYTPEKTPLNEAGVEVTKYAPHILSVRFFTASVIDPNEPNYGIRLFYGLVKPGILPTGERPTSAFLATDTHVLSWPPLTAEDLPDSFFTRRATDNVKLPPIASGMMCYLAPRYEISKGHVAGPWGTLVSAFVP
jgi:hypothetical protein